MKLNYLKFGTTAFLWLFGTALVSAQQLTDQLAINLNDLSSFKDPGKSWSLAKDVTASLKTDNELTITKGAGILVNSPDKKNQGADLFTNALHGNMILELDYLMAKGSNSGIYLQGNYEIQLRDSWGNTNPLSSDNGGIYERWDDSKPEGQKGYNGYAPRQNVSKAPGLWQHLKIAFQAPQFDAGGNKIANARILTAELNGIIIHENVELSGPTRGASDKEKALGALRLQGDHGAVAFKNIKISKLPNDLLNGGQKGGGGADPIYIGAATNTMIRSFVDFAPNQRSVHAISVGSPKQVHYSYDFDNGLLLHGWHGEFVDATPMWDGRGNGTSKARGAVTTFTKKLIPAVAQLSNPQAIWPVDSTGTGFRSKGYVMDNEERPEFKYNIYGAQVTDAIKALDNGKGLSRTITIDKPVTGLYVLLANASTIDELIQGFYVVDGKAFYLELDETANKPIIRDVDGRKEMIILLGNKLKYFISF
ncbi:MAG: DUF1080 domain-containing protein [Candidatus Pedobacter colombiensis]|uniref:DUF1080 domain-containing protein n=1 Tax=Candidatus Pedobacter colombiensis TaxID=3121371 RepID=A0AAJ5W9Y8_9SPHI|nr:DUF1080 domain-containing protein [Pedobacter sp.]WEK21518.1 MAG: DUF1080 domain-containing protein [Pedobacter sp.]